MSDSRTPSGFSLIETTIALGLVSFVLIALLGLLSHSVRQSHELVSGHQSHSAFAALEEYFSVATNGYSNASTLPASNAASVYYAIVSTSDNDQLAWEVNPDPNAVGTGPYRYLARLNISPFTNSTNAFRLLVRAQFYPIPSGAQPPAAMRPEYQADFSVSR